MKLLQFVLQIRNLATFSRRLMLTETFFQALIDIRLQFHEMLAGLWVCFNAVVNFRHDPRKHLANATACIKPIYGDHKNKNCAFYFFPFTIYGHRYSGYDGAYR